MKKNFIAIISGIFISVPSLFAFHDLATDHLVPGMPVVFIATGPKFPPAMHDAVRTVLVGGPLQTVLCLCKTP